jgi:protoporphyrin/coproporphyrin ferrochelatase
VTPSVASERPVALLLFNLGGPDTLADVEPFLINLFSDREIIELPGGPRLQPFFAWLIAKKRGPSVRENYRKIGGGSPQLRLTRAQGRAVEERLNARAGHFRSFIAMRYWKPSTEEALEAIEATGMTRIVTLTMYPHYSCATTGSSESELRRVLATPRWKGRFEVSGVASYPDDPTYLDALADTVRKGLGGFSPHVRDRVVLLFSAHGLPKKFVDRGDPYVEHTMATRDGILARLNVPNRQVLGFQSRTGPVEWIGPGTDQVIKELGQEGVKEVLVVPLSFVSDHIETLYEVDMLFRDDAERAGIVDYRRTEALNTHPLFIEALAGLVERHVMETACST